MNTIDFADINVKGELAVRAGRNFTRLEDKWYRPEEVFTADQHGWPGDWEGRLILALSLLTQSTHRTAAYLDEIVEELPKHFNEKGYLGNILPAEQFDEQQMAGHSWLIRGLLEYFHLTGNVRVKQMAENIVKELLLPVCTYYARYPIEPESRLKQQDIWILSKLQTKTKNHAESSDAGCAFIMLDGATAAYEAFGLPKLRELIDEMICRYTEMDFMKLHIQTHATLSACRGIFRFYELTGERKYLDIVDGIFKLYQAEAWSEAFGNYNWFGLPRWTEPCAIIDSFIMAVNMWRATKNQEFIENAHYIYYNAISHGQRAEGGFGTDLCTGARESAEPLLLEPVTYDVYWCCNMRGGEGLSRAVEYLFFTEQNKIFVPFFSSCDAKLTFSDGEILLEEKSMYPYVGEIEFKVKRNTTASKKELFFFFPSWAKPDSASVTANGVAAAVYWKEGFLAVDIALKEEDVITFRFLQEFKIKEAEFKNSVTGYRKYIYGPMLLGMKRDKEQKEVFLPENGDVTRIGKSEFKIKENDTEFVLSALCDVMNPTNENSKRQILFRSQS